jgi:hypothetical protein
MFDCDAGIGNACSQFRGRPFVALDPIRNYGWGLARFFSKASGSEIDRSAALLCPILWRMHQIGIID